jgi:hypothetical protein
LEKTTMIMDEAIQKRAAEVRRLMNERIRNMTPQERDRLMQVFLAQARGPEANARLLHDMMNVMIRTHTTKTTGEADD